MAHSHRHKHTLRDRPSSPDQPDLCAASDERRQAAINHDGGYARCVADDLAVTVRYWWLLRGARGCAVPWSGQMTGSRIGREGWAWRFELNVDVTGALSALAAHRPVFHSERDFQHALAWQIQLASPAAQIRLETRPQPGLHLDLLVRLDGTRTAIELKYLLAALRVTVGDEQFELPHRSANDIGRHDVVKDITRVETMLADGYADHGCVVVLTNDRSYWQPAARTGTIDAAFRLHEGRVLEGTVGWAAHAGTGTTDRRDTPLRLAGRYACHWHDYSRLSLADGRSAAFRYLLINASAGQASPPRAQPAPRPQRALRSSPPADGARQEILTAARRLISRSPDGSFTLAQILDEVCRADSRYAESTIRTHVTSRMCGDSPDHHGTTYDDLERLDRGRYRLRTTSPH